MTLDPLLPQGSSKPGDIHGPFLTPKKREELEGSTIPSEGPGIKADIEQVRALNAVVEEAPSRKKPFTVESFINDFAEIKPGEFKTLLKKKFPDEVDRMQAIRKEYEELSKVLAEGLVSFAHANRRLFKDKESLYNSKAIALASVLDRDTTKALLKDFTENDTESLGQEEKAARSKFLSEKILGVVIVADKLMKTNASQEEYANAALFRDLGSLISDQTLKNNQQFLLRPLDKSKLRDDFQVIDGGEALEQLDLPFPVDSLNPEKEGTKSLGALNILLEESAASFTDAKLTSAEENFIYDLVSCSYIFDYAEKSGIANLLRNINSLAPHGKSYRITTNPEDAVRSTPLLTYSIASSSDFKRLISSIDARIRRTGDPEEISCLKGRKKFYETFFPWIKEESSKLRRQIFDMDILNPMDFAVKDKESREFHIQPDLI